MCALLADVPVSRTALFVKEPDDLGIANNTIVIYTTDNGPHHYMWPDASFTPFRGEKNTNWEGDYAVAQIAESRKMAHPASARMSSLVRRFKG